MVHGMSLNFKSMDGDLNLFASFDNLFWLTSSTQTKTTCPTWRCYPWKKHVFSEFQLDWFKTTVTMTIVWKMFQEHHSNKRLRWTNAGGCSKRQVAPEPAKEVWHNHTSGCQSSFPYLQLHLFPTKTWNRRKQLDRTTSKKHAKHLNNLPKNKLELNIFFILAAALQSSRRWWPPYLACQLNNYRPENIQKNQIQWSNKWISFRV